MKFTNRTLAQKAPAHNDHRLSRLCEMISCLKREPRTANVISPTPGSRLPLFIVKSFSNSKPHSLNQLLTVIDLGKFKAGLGLTLGIDPSKTQLLLKIGLHHRCNVTSH